MSHNYCHQGKIFYGNATTNSEIVVPVLYAVITEMLVSSFSNLQDERPFPVRCISKDKTKQKL